MTQTPQKVYIVTAGSYSDYHICRVFLDKKKAETYCALLNEAEVEEYDISDAAVSAVEYCIGYRMDSISILQDGSMYYNYGTFSPSTKDENSVDSPGCEAPDGYLSVDRYNIRWNMEEYEKQEKFFDSPPWLFGAAMNMPNVPKEAIPLCTITRTTKQIRNDREPEKAVLRKQLIDIANEVKYQLAHGVSHESVAQWLSLR